MVFGTLRVKAYNLTLNIQPYMWFSKFTDLADHSYLPLQPATINILTTSRISGIPTLGSRSEVIKLILCSTLLSMNLIMLIIVKTKFLIYVKLVLISDTYCILIYCYLPLLPHKKGGELTLGSSLDRVDLQLYRKRGK